MIVNRAVVDPATGSATALFFMDNDMEHYRACRSFHSATHLCVTAIRMESRPCQTLLKTLMKRSYPTMTTETAFSAVRSTVTAPDVSAARDTVLSVPSEEETVTE